jgi:hypothetical protein
VVVVVVVVVAAVVSEVLGVEITIMMSMVAPVAAAAAEVVTRLRYVEQLLWEIRMELVLISLADSQHNLYDKYLLLCIQY